MKYMTWFESAQGFLPERSGDECLLFPCALPYPEVLRIKEAGSEAEACLVWAKHLLNGFVAWSNFVVLGCPGGAHEPQVVYRSASEASERLWRLLLQLLLRPWPSRHNVWQCRRKLAAWIHLIGCHPSRSDVFLVTGYLSRRRTYSLAVRRAISCDNQYLRASGLILTLFIDMAVTGYSRGNFEEGRPVYTSTISSSRIVDDPDMKLVKAAENIYDEARLKGALLPTTSHLHLCEQDAPDALVQELWRRSLRSRPKPLPSQALARGPCGERSEFWPANTTEGRSSSLKLNGILRGWKPVPPPRPAPAWLQAHCGRGGDPKGTRKWLLRPRAPGRIEGAAVRCGHVRLNGG